MLICTPLESVQFLAAAAKSKSRKFLMAVAPRDTKALVLARASGTSAYTHLQHLARSASISREEKAHARSGVAHGEQRLRMRQRKAKRTPVGDLRGKGFFICLFQHIARYDADLRAARVYGGVFRYVHYAQFAPGDDGIAFPCGVGHEIVDGVAQRLR